ncbi:MAG TPA: ABC transporter ATP-binding protein [Propionibacteriaceae bacterium]|nr:ABC transporter ATP-binding protein [Propionibacteriaceae bacterium]
MVAGLAADLTVRRGTFTLQLALAAGPGEVVVLLGPNGAGKSTALRALAGLLALDAGRIQIDGAVLADPARGLHVPPHQRPVGVVFQDYLLFPHLSVLDNVAFGPQTRGVHRSDARRQAADLLDRIGVADLATARPRSISGGQAQRVALARALATEPALLLLDEPLAALDARTRLLVRAELRRHLAGFAGATVVITHDPVDAAVLGDRLVVIEDGRMVQAGRPADVARQPRTDYVARLVGLNLLAGRAVGPRVLLPGGGTVTAAEPSWGEVYAAFRPAAVALFLARPAGSPRNVWPGRITGLEPHGDGVRVEVGGAPDPASTLLAEVTPAAVAELGLAPGIEIWAAVKASDIDVYPRAP